MTAARSPSVPARRRHRYGKRRFVQLYQFQGRDFRLTDVHGRVVTDILA